MTSLLLLLVLAQPVPDTCVVERVHDGDTLTCRSGERVRLLLVDAPELKQRRGVEARNLLRELLPEGTTVLLQYDKQKRDRYRRLLAYVSRTDETDINAALLEAGLAVVLHYAPNGARLDLYRQAEAEARTAGAGLWQDADHCSPRDFRKRRCK